MSKGGLLFVAGAVLFLCTGCPIDGGGNGDVDPPVDYSQAMRGFVQTVSTFAKSAAPGFLVVVQNGETLLTDNGLPTGSPNINYLNAIDGQAREDVFFGYLADDAATPVPERNAMLAMLDWAEARGVEAFVIDHCTTPSRVDTSLEWSATRGYASTATCRALDSIPPYPYLGQPYRVNGDDVLSLGAAQNMLCFLDPCRYATCEAYLYALQMSNFDLLVLDSCFGGQVLAPAEVEAAKTKYNGGRRLVLAALNIGQAETYRSYWRSTWQTGRPAWLEETDPTWPGRHYVQYWHPDWQAIVLDCVAQIIDAGFDGVYLTGIESYERSDLLTAR